jgi:hypothetical protein
MKIELIIDDAVAFITAIRRDPDGTLSLLPAREQAEIKLAITDLLTELEQPLNQAARLHKANRVILLIESNRTLSEQLIPGVKSDVIAEQARQDFRQRESLIALYLAQHNNSAHDPYSDLAWQYIASMLGNVLDVLDNPEPDAEP